MLLKRRDMLVMSALFAAGLLGGCRNRPEPLLRIGSVLWPGHEPLNIARELGHLGETIQLVEYAGTPDVHRSFRNKAIEAACITLDEALQLAQYEPEVQVILAMNISNGADALLTKPEFNSPDHLRGKKIAVSLNAVGSFLLGSFLEKVALTTADVIIVPTTVGESEEMFLEGEVDAVITCEPIASRLTAMGAVNLFDSSQMPGEIIDVLVVRSQTLQTHPESLTTVLRGWFKGVEICVRDTEQADRIGGTHHGITKEQFRDTLRRLEFLSPERNFEMFATPAGSLHDAVRKISANMQKYQLLEKMVDPATLLDASILKRATK